MVLQMLRGTRGWRLSGPPSASALEFAARGSRSLGPSAGVGTPHEVERPRDKPAFKLCCAALALLALISASEARAKDLTMTIDSTPQGARIEFKGNTLGTTPYAVLYPKNFFRSPGTYFSRHLAEPMVVTFYLDGYYPKTVELTHGPFEWRSLNGANAYIYYLLDTSYDVVLDPIDAAPQAPPKVEPSSASGTGFHFLDTGLIATNYHVVDGATEIRVGPGDGCPASVLVFDASNDLAVLRVDPGCPTSLDLGPPLLPGTSGSVSIGDSVVTFGYPLANEFGAEPQASAGIIKSTSGLEGDPRTLTISNSVQPGNSGGPLFGPDGRVIGVVSSTMNANYLYPRYKALPQELNFAVKIEYLMLLLQMKSSALGASGSALPGSTSPNAQGSRLSTPLSAGLPKFFETIRSSVVLIRVRLAAH